MALGDDEDAQRRISDKNHYFKRKWSINLKILDLIGTVSQRKKIQEVFMTFVTMRR